jgi:hypothetical protein
MNKQVMTVGVLPSRLDMNREEEGFVYYHGACHCFQATFKNATSILSALKNEYPEESWSEYKEKILKLSGKTVIAYAYGEPTFRVSDKVKKSELVSVIFVEGDDNICFNSECFI